MGNIYSQPKKTLFKNFSKSFPDSSIILKKIYLNDNLLIKKRISLKIIEF